MTIRGPRNSDNAEWLRMRRALWGDCPDEQQVREMEEILGSDMDEVFVAEAQHAAILGELRGKWERAQQELK